MNNSIWKRAPFAASMVAAAAALGMIVLTAPVQGQGKGKGGGRGGVPQAPPVEQKGPPEPNVGNTEIHALKVQGNVWMLVGAGGNMAVQAGPSGVLVVDAEYAALSNKVLAEIRKISPNELRYIIDTSPDLDHIGGNYNLNRAGAPVIGGNLGAAAQTRGATIVAHENLLNNHLSAPSGKTPPFPEGWWPGDTYSEGQKEIYFNGEAVIVMHHDAAHTDSDSIVHFRGSDVVATGDIFNTNTFPVIKLDEGGSVTGVIAALNHVLDIAIPEHEQEGGTMIIPGHGRLCDEHDVLEYRDMVTIVRDRVEAMIKKNMTLEQVQAANPTKEYDSRWGGKGGPWTSAMFVDAVYKSLKK